MILVTVGMHSQPFDRLVRAADELGTIVREIVLIQRGVSRCETSTSQSFDFADQATMSAYIARARAVVAHGGAGSILEVLLADKPLVLVPRLKRFGECLDDHQVELVSSLVEQGRAVAVMDPSAESLRAAITRAGQLTEHGTEAGSLQRDLGAWLAQWSTREPKAKTPWRFLASRRQG
jgi:UDP-N-acetylglucosamine transferase subunit ALG13